MQARVMVSSVMKDSISLGNPSILKGIWSDPENFLGRLKKNGYRAESGVPFAAIRNEIAHHLKQKYGFDVYTFEGSPGQGRAPAEETVLEARKSDLVIGIFGASMGWTVPDQDPLSPTLREWRAALETPLKFRVFWLSGSVKPESVPGQLGRVLQSLSEYKTGKIYTEFLDACDLFAKIDRDVQFYINRAVKKYVSDIVSKEPSTEHEDWLLSDYRTRNQKMMSALSGAARSLKISTDWLLQDYSQPVSLNCVPDSFSIPESRKFVAYVFDAEVETRVAGSLGKLHVIAAFGGITEGQIRRHVVWYEAERILRESDRAIFIGYSLPEDDVEVVCLLKRSLAHLTPAQITVVDYDPSIPVIAAQSVGRRYRTLFGDGIDWHPERMDLWLKSAGAG